MLFKWLTIWVTEQGERCYVIDGEDEDEEDEEDEYDDEEDEYDDEEDEEDEEDDDEYDDEEDDDEEDYIDGEEKDDSSDEDAVRKRRNRNRVPTTNASPSSLVMHVPSATRSNVTYSIDPLNCTCTCPDFVHRRKADTHSTCKHLRGVLASLYWLAYTNDQLPKNEDGYRMLPLVEM